MRTPQTTGDRTRQGYAAIYEMELSPDDALEYLRDPANFLSVHDGIVRELTFLGDSGSDEELYAAFLRRVKNSETKISKFIRREQPESGKAYKWFYKSRGGKEDCPPSRDDAIKLCFALEMHDLDRAADFLWKVCRLNGFCFRRAEDVVYCYCLANNLGYPAAKDLIKKYEGYKTEPEASVLPHITRTQTICDLFGNLRGMERSDFEALLFANKHNFLGYSKTAHEKMLEAYNEVKAEIEKERALASRSACLSEQIEVRAKDKNGKLCVEYRTADFSVIGELNIVDAGGINKTCGDGDELIRKTTQYSPIRRTRKKSVNGQILSRLAFDVKKIKEQYAAALAAIKTKIAENPVKSAYVALWSEYKDLLKERKDDSTSYRVTLLNNSNQILEHYFIQLCGYSRDVRKAINAKRSESPGGDAQRPKYLLALSMLDSITSDSRHAPDSAYFSGGAVDAEQYREAFKLIFDAMKHEQHYEKIMK